MTPAQQPTHSAVFVMPHYATKTEDTAYLEEAIQGLLNQTDQDWRLIIVDDASPLPEAKLCLRSLAAAHSKRIDVYWSKMNLGPGPCRNIGVTRALELSAPFILYHDADDVADRRRLELTRRAFADHRVGFVYSRFRVIDESSRVIPRAKLTPSLREILIALDVAPPSGAGAVVLEGLGTRTGYATLTSTVAVRTGLAAEHPFPDERVSEDAFTWFQYAAASDQVVFLPEVLALYRVPRNCRGSACRTRIGTSYYAHKARVDTRGFFQALDIAIARGQFDLCRLQEVSARFHERLATTMLAEGKTQLAAGLLSMKAMLSRLSTSTPDVLADERNRPLPCLDPIG